MTDVIVGFRWPYHVGPDTEALEAKLGKLRRYADDVIAKAFADNGYMNLEPVNLTQALSSFDDVYSPRIVTRMNDYDVRIAHAKGEHLWHVHSDTDEFFLVLDGQLDIAMQGHRRQRAHGQLGQGDVYVVPKGTEHKPASAAGADILMFEPAQTLTTGDWHEGEIPAHVDSTTGHDL